ncbi:MAG: nucleotidyl transferase AbiEii/AbiGii toxin family protein [Bacteroidales bacterium]|jgi:hypothetical protein
MLHFDTVDPAALELLENIQKQPVFSGLRLVGGTSLSLQIGHRKSIDLDLFGTLHSDEYAINKNLKKLGSVKLLKKTENINIYLINNIKVDIVNYPYEWLERPVTSGTLVLAGKKDIAAMKLSAVAGRGTKKDFIDIYFLLQKFSLSEMLSFYNKKYPDGSEFIVLKSLAYFDDADADEDSLMLIPVSWEMVKKKIAKTLENFIHKKN